MVEGEPNEGLEDLQRWTLWSGGIFKEVDFVSINNGEVQGKIFVGDLVEEAKVKMKAYSWIQISVETLV